MLTGPLVAGVVDTLVRALVVGEDPVPKTEDVVAGPWGALIFVAFIGAAVFLAFSFVKQLRKAQAAKDAGVFGDPPEEADGEGDG